MIISDLSYCEDVELETRIVGGMMFFDKVDSFTFDKDVNLDVSTALDINTDINAEFDLNVWGIMWSNVDVTGNFGSLEFDLTAAGDNSVAEANTSLLVTDNLVEASGSLFGAVG